MDSKTYVTLDMQAPNIAVVAAGKQNDLMSRQIVCQLQDGSVPFTPPVDAAAMIRYAKPDNTAGFYDVLEDGTTPAWSVSGSTITITLCEQMLTVAGRVWVEINFYTATAKLTTFYFLLEVQRSVLDDATIISSDYYNVLSAQIQALLGAIVNPPQIDPITKNWLLWDENTGAYVDSGFSSVGTTGPQGPKGDPGEYSAQNPPPYPVRSVNGQTGDVSVKAAASAVVFGLGAGASGITSSGTGIYDPNTSTVRIYVFARSTSNITSITPIATIPEAYRPSSNTAIYGMMSTEAVRGVAYFGRARANGDITQDIGNEVREVVLVGEYPI